MTVQDAPADAPLARGARGRWVRLAKAGGLGFLVLTIGIMITASLFADAIQVNGHTAADLNPIELTGASAAGAAGLVVGLGAIIVALLAALVATALSLAVGLLGAGLGLFLAVGIATGPILLAVIVGVLIKRRYYPDVI